MRLCENLRIRHGHADEAAMMHKYDRLLQRVEALDNQIRPMRVVFKTIRPGEPEPLDPTPDPSRFTVIFVTRYLSQEESEAHIRRDRERSHVWPEPR
jgi:hypothetical protein